MKSIKINKHSPMCMYVCDTCDSCSTLDIKYSFSCIPLVYPSISDGEGVGVHSAVNFLWRRPENGITSPGTRITCSYEPHLKIFGK